MYCFSSSSSSKFLLISIFIFILLDSGIRTRAKNVRLGCKAAERKALLNFRESLVDTSKNLSSWKNTDCCAWPGVRCSNSTGHVIGLDLGNNGLNIFIDNMLPGKLLDSSPLSELSLLEYLDLSGVNLSRSHLDKVVSRLPRLSVLKLSSTGLDNTNIPHTCFNSTLLSSVQFLDLSQNSFTGELPCFLHNMTSLKHLDLSYNMYNSSVQNPRFLLPNNIAHIDLSFNLMYRDTDWISDFLSDKCRLRSLQLSGNQFYGDMSRVIKNLTGCWVHTLENLNMGANELNGPVPIFLGKLSALIALDVSDNRLSGPIPSSCGSLRALRVLKLNKNQLSGDIPVSLGHLSDLEMIDLSSNFFNTSLSEAHLANLTRLKFLSVSMLDDFSVSRDWMPPFRLENLFMRSCKTGGQFPEWIRHQDTLNWLVLSNCNITATSLPEWLTYFTNLYVLDLSHNHIGGGISHSFCKMKDLFRLDLSDNRFTGTLPNCWPNLPSLQVARLSSNELTGVIPNSIGGAYYLKWLHLNNNSLTGQLPPTLNNCTMLVVLDVGDNKLSGKLPEYWTAEYMAVLILRNNGFYGTIPSAFCRLHQLQLMDLSRNKLTGKIPHCFGNFSGMIISHPIVVSYDSEWRSVTINQVMKGVQFDYTTTAKYVVNLDLSSNYLVGEIPSELTQLSSLVGLNLSHNHLAGRIPAKVGDLKSLESLDLSHNNLVGKIPDSVSKLEFLSHLNLSSNNLSGQIPTGRQLQTLNDPSIFSGNPLLCGPPLLEKCHSDENHGAPTHEDEHEDDRADEIRFYAVLISGFATGLWGIMGVLIFKTTWRQALFRFVEVAVGKMFGY